MDRRTPVEQASLWLPQTAELDNGSHHGDSFTHEYDDEVDEDSEDESCDQDDELDYFEEPQRGEPSRDINSSNYARAHSDGWFYSDHDDDDMGDDETEDDSAEEQADESNDEGEEEQYEDDDSVFEDEEG